MKSLLFNESSETPSNEAFADIYREILGGEYFPSVNQLHGATLTRFRAARTNAKRVLRVVPPPTAAGGSLAEVMGENEDEETILLKGEEEGQQENDKEEEVEIEVEEVASVHPASDSSLSQRLLERLGADVVVHLVDAKTSRKGAPPGSAAWQQTRAYAELVDPRGIMPPSRLVVSARSKSTYVSFCFRRVLVCMTFFHYMKRLTCLLQYIDKYIHHPHPHFCSLPCSRLCLASHRSWTSATRSSSGPSTAQAGTCVASPPGTTQWWQRNGRGGEGTASRATTSAGRGCTD